MLLFLCGQKNMLKKYETMYIICLLNEIVLSLADLPICQPNIFIFPQGAPVGDTGNTTDGVMMLISGMKCVHKM